MPSAKPRRPRPTSSWPASAVTFSELNRHIVWNIVRSQVPNVGRTSRLRHTKPMGGARMKWVTRARPKVDRIACPWLIKKFVDPDAEFLYVPAEQVMAVADREAAIAFDVPEVELGHHGLECSFDD